MQSETVEKFDPQEAILSQEDVWAIFGQGRDPMIVGHRMPDAADKKPADAVVHEDVQGQVKRHLFDPAGDVNFSKDAKATHILVLEYPVTPEYPAAEKPFYLGNTRIYGMFVVLWHDATTGEDRYIHCLGCVRTVASFLALKQQEWVDAAAHRKTLN